MSQTVVSSPGKVLIAGGYLVLDPKYPGIVVSTSSRFYTVIQDSSASLGKGVIQVRSPQFEAATWRYDAIIGSTGVKVEASVDNKSKNKFVHLALQNTIKLAVELKGASAVEERLASGLDIAIEGGNDFYSQRAKLVSLGLPRTLDSLSKIPPFVPTGVALSDVHKTGLGSSAALITSLVSGLLAHLGAIAPAALADENHSDRRLAHNAAQFIHCLAQGKIGSGFDVSAAVFGSHLYQRFDPDVLKELMGEDLSSKQILPVLSTDNKGWDYQVKPFQLPPLTRIMLADIDAGSDTPSLVGKVLKWRKESSKEAEELWTNLDKLNRTLADVLLNISELYTKSSVRYAEAVEALSILPASKWNTTDGLNGDEEIRNAFYEAHTISEQIREKMREMGTAAGVPIEPPEQTKLLDSCISQAGIIAGGVPGAGGYDAVWLLVFEVPGGTPVKLVQDVWASYKELDVSPLSASESMAKGIRAETLEDVQGLKAAIAL